MKTLLVGMGNPILTDDGVGVHLARDLRRALRGAPGLDVVEECSVGGLNLLQVVAGYERVVLVDSIRTPGGIPGTWYRFTASSLRETTNLRNVHDTNLATALELGRRLGTPLPPDDEIHVFAVEIKDDATFGERLTGEVESAYPEILSEMLVELRGLLGS